MRFSPTNWLLLICALLLVLGAGAQNIVQESGGEVLPPRPLSSEEKELLTTEMGLKLWPVDERLLPRVQELEREVEALIDGWPWRPLFHQLGISGAETHFDHPDELFAVLAEALPVVRAPVAKRTREFLAARLREAPPYAIEGFDRGVGQPRERYAVPEKLRAKGRGIARDAWGVYAFFDYLRAAQEMEQAKEHWPAIRARLRPLLENEYAFDPRKPTYVHDEAQRLNGDLAGLHAAIHLARIAGDEDSRKQATARAEQLLQLRVDLERVNPQILEKTDASTKSLHHAKLARYLHLPEVATRILSDEFILKRVKQFREARPGWWMAFGDRFIGGENYTTSPDFGRALFTAAVRIENTRFFALTASGEVRWERTMDWLDVPWCKADLYFIERLAMILQTPFGR